MYKCAKNPKQTECCYNTEEEGLRKSDMLDKKLMFLLPVKCEFLELTATESYSGCVCHYLVG